MNLESLRWGEWIAAIAGLDLALVTFRAWYKVTGADVRVTAWDGLENGRYLLLATAVVGVVLLVLVAAEQSSELSFPPGALAAVIGAACTGYVAYRLASPPSDAADPDIGLYFGLASAAGVALGGVLSMREAGAAPAYEPAVAAAAASPAAAPATFTGPAGEPAGTPWSPSAPPPATAAGAAAVGAAGVQPGDQITLTSAGSRFPAGTAAVVVQVFSGGVLAEVTAADGLAERLEVPDGGFERGGGGAWSPGLPQATSQDWGFDESAGAAGTATLEPGDAEDGEKRPGFFKRLFGGGGKAAPEETAEVAPEVAPEPEPPAPQPEPEPEPPAPEPEPEPEVAVAEPEPEPAAPAPEPEPPAPEPEVEVVAPEPELAAEPEPEVVVTPPEPEPEPAPPAPEPEPEPEPPAAPPEPEVAAPEPEPAPKPARKRSSGSRKVPKEAVQAAAADAGPPKVGDSVQLTVSGGQWDAGTRGTVVDVFSAGVIVEVTGDDGRTERLDLPFEAVGPADGK